MPRLIKTLAFVLDVPLFPARITVLLFNKTHTPQVKARLFGNEPDLLLTCRKIDNQRRIGEKAPIAPRAIIRHIDRTGYIHTVYLNPQFCISTPCTAKYPTGSGHSLAHFDSPYRCRFRSARGASAASIFRSIT